MESIPDGKDPITDSQREGDPVATEVLTSPPQAQRPPPLVSPATVDGARHAGAGRRSLSKKILRPTVLAAFGVALIFVARWLYSSPGELPTPSFATIQLNSTFPVADILYDVSQTSGSLAEITISVQLPNNVRQPPAKAPAAELWLELPPRIAFNTCPANICYFDQNDKEYTWQWWLNFSHENSDNNSGVALATFFVKAHAFGYVSDDTNASAAIPRADFFGPGTPILYTEYNASASSYDWSSFQPQLTSATEILWDDPVTSGGTPGIVAGGINHANEDKDNYKTFFAGALLGVAGGALLAAVQEILHANDERDLCRDLYERFVTGPRDPARE